MSIMPQQLAWDKQTDEIEGDVRTMILKANIATSYELDVLGPHFVVNIHSIKIFQ